MNTLIVGLFENETLAIEAARILNNIGCSKSNIALVSRNDRTGSASYVKEFSPFSALVRIVVKSAIIGSIIVFLITAATAIPLVHSLWMKILLLVTTWKLGAIVGSLAGLFYGMSDTFPDTLPDWGLAHMQPGGAMVAAKAGKDKLPSIRGALIESAVSDLYEWEINDAIYDLRLV